tara:strand:+ start:237 stop:1061 length:825 start_codon:yes stop_codon:yes gene_type:complete
MNNTNKLTLFSVIDNEKYEKFVIPFIFFPLITNDDVQVEIRVKNYSNFLEKYKDALALLEAYFPKRYLIKPLQGYFFETLPCGSTARFYLIPELKSKWTKITDIDIMHIQKDLVKDFDELEKLSPESNYFALKRRESDKVSGTMCVKTEAFYSEEWKENLDNYMEQIRLQDKWVKKFPPFDAPHYYYDEFVNYDLVVPVHGLPITLEGVNVRPIQGIHISPNRPPYPTLANPNFPDWEITDEKKKRIQELMSLRMFEALSPFIDEEMINLFKMI